MDVAIRQLVRQRAGDRCEYCHLKQEDLPFTTFQVEHVIPRKHRGSDEAENLAFACERCNSHKGTNLSGIDPETGKITTLFNPRQDVWDEHFRTSGAWIVNMNEERRVRLRGVLLRRKAE